MRRHVPITDLATYKGKFVSPIQLAEYMNVARRTIYYHIEKGALRSVQRRRVIRIRIADAREYAGETAPPPATSVQGFRQVPA